MCDASLNLYDFEARLYSPVTGRFVRVDPMAETYYPISPFVYCCNDPIAYIDPDGDSWYYSGTNGAFLGHIYDEDDNIYVISSEQMKLAQRCQNNERRYSHKLASFRSEDNMMGRMVLDDILSQDVANGIFEDLFYRANKIEEGGKESYITDGINITVNLVGFGAQASSTSDTINIFAKEIGFKGYDIISTFAHELGHILDRKSGFLQNEKISEDCSVFEKSADDFANSHWSFPKISQLKMQQYDQHAEENGY